MKFVEGTADDVRSGCGDRACGRPGYSQTTAPKPPAGTAAAGDRRPPRAPAAPPAAAQPAPAPQPPAPFPEGAKFAFIDIQAIASNSAEGKSATAKLDELRRRRRTRS